MKKKAMNSLYIIAAIAMLFFVSIAWLNSSRLLILVSDIVIAVIGVFSVLVMGAGLFLGRLFYLTRQAELSRDRTLATNEARLSDIGIVAENDRMIANARLMSATIRQIEQGVIHAGQLGEGAKFSSFPVSVIKSVEAEVPLLEAPPKELLPAIRGMQNLLIIGGKGTGKTTLLQHLESERIHEGQTIALDSHAVPGQWAGQSVGAGRNYGQIKNAMIALVDKMDKRHKERTAGKVHFEPVHTLIDEFTLLPGYLKDAGYNVQDYSFPLLTEGRKADMNCVWGSHSDRAKPLGLEGMADLRECFDALIYLKKVKGKYFAFVDFGEGREDVRYLLPGPFIIQQNAPAMSPEPEAAPKATIDDLSFMVAETKPEQAKPSNDEEKAIIAFVTVRDSGKFSMNKVIKLAFGENKTGVFYHDKLKKILDKFNIDYSDII